MPAQLEGRRRNFVQGLPFILIPAILIYPALRFVSICPPSNAKGLSISLALVFAASEVWGAVKMFKCLIGKWDFLAVGAIFGAVIGGVMLWFMLLIGVFAMHPRK